MELHNNWQEEKRSAYIYNVMSECETNILHKKLFTDLMHAAEKQASVWEHKIKSEGLPAPAPFKPTFRCRLISFLIRVMGSDRLHPILSAMKIRGMSIFTSYHHEHQHTTLGSANNLRAAVFGINDGLVSNMSLILGVAGASANHQTIILAGVAGLLAGACSMGAGEYISVRSQREVYEYQIAIEKQELEEYPEEEMQELSLIYQARGVPLAEADNLAEIMIKNPDTGLNALAREELGLNPDELVSPVGAMLSSFFSFAIGAIIPIIPFLIQGFSWSLQLSALLTGIALFSVGALLSLYTNRNPIWLGIRMMLIGGVAGTLTYIIGMWLGTTLS